MQREWLPKCDDLPARLGVMEGIADGAARWKALRTLAARDHDFPSTLRLDRFVRRQLEQALPESLEGLHRVRLALLSTSTTGHLAAGIRVAGLGRGLLIEIFEPDYGQTWQQIADPASALHAFAPNAVLFANDPYSLFGTGADIADQDGPAKSVEAAVEARRGQWRRVREAWNATVIQQVPFNPFPRLMGENEARLAGSPAAMIRAFQEKLRLAAAQDSADLIDLETWTARDGLASWHSPALWHRAKQEIHPSASPFYGDLVARLLAARAGRAAKCLVLDLDNTLWGGVVGDDGLDGIVIGQGSAVGEAHLAFQHYARQLGQRGVILAVCSKNDEAVARRVFVEHPEMVLRLGDIGCFVANWQDKAGNIRRIAAELNIGLDSLVFVDDNPFERELVRGELPDVFVPELPEEAADYARIVADSGCFECVSLTAEDLAKTQQYQSNARRKALLEEVTDLDGYLAALDMTLKTGAFDEIGLPRIVQLINKTNQFNLTTRRYTDAQARKLLTDPLAVTRQFRLLDRFGDNGIIAIVIGFFDQATRCVTLDTWLMSCRVLGRQVEQATLNAIVEAARALGAHSIIGEYVPSLRNAMVKDHYEKLGFSPIGPNGETSRWSLSVDDYVPSQTHIRLEAAP